MQFVGTNIHKYNRLKSKWSVVQYPENFELSNYNKSMSCVTMDRLE